MGYSPGEQQVIDAIRGLKVTLDHTWLHGLPLVRDDIFHTLIPAAERYLQEHPLDHQARTWVYEIETGADRYLFNGGVATRFCGNLNQGRVITISRKEYRTFIKMAKELPNERSSISISDGSERAEFVFLPPRGINPDAETVPLSMVQEDRTPGPLARWGMTLRWVD